METFNLAFVLRSRLLPPNCAHSVVTIVCASEDTIDRDEVRRVAFECLNQSLASHKGTNGFPHVNAVFCDVIRTIKNECDVQAVMVESDCSAMISI